MIKVDERKLKQMEHRHLTYFEKDTDGLTNLQYFASLPYRLKKEQKIMQYLEQNYKKILIGKPAELADVIGNITQMNGGLTLRKGFYKRLQLIFNYSSFSTKGPGHTNDVWGGFLFVKELDLPVCPYCNRQYITVYRYKTKRKKGVPQPIEEGQTRGALDHFFDKTRYPFLALSLYNLIPSCKVCNSDFKLSQKMSLTEYLHPYTEGFGKKVRFTIIPKSQPAASSTAPPSYDVNALLGSNDVFDLGLRYLSNDVSFDERARRNAQLFKIEPIYNSHKDIIRELLQKQQHYPADYIDRMLKVSGKLFQSREEVVRMVIGNYMLEEDHSKRIMAKMMSDIADELTLLQYL